ncbi:MAG TPA: hypothetical protein VIV12_08800 [Streptosporangiaceae bacterium]
MGRVVAADPIDDAPPTSPFPFTGGGVGVADRGVDLGAQRGGAVGEVAAQHGEAEGAEWLA